MDAALKTEWMKALRSGEFQQERRSIGDKLTRHLCCLGVGAVVANPLIHLGCTDSAVDELNKHGLAGYDAEHGYSESVQRLIDMNDIQENSFAEIADWIEANL